MQATVRVATTRQGIKVLALAGIASLATSTTAQAVDFTLNFQPTVSAWTGQTGFCSPTTPACANQLGNGDPTPFELTLQNIGGTTYFHTLVGDPASGFAIESYTRWAGGPNDTRTNPTDITGQCCNFSPDSGGNARSVIGDGSATDISVWPNISNLSQPFAQPQISGTGTGDPTQTVFRMVMTSAKGDMSMEVSKPYLDKKPMISQTVQDGTMSSNFVADMRAISYSDMNTPAQVTNTLTISDPALNGNADFQMALAQHPDVTAGRYTYTPGTGWNTANGWDVAGSTFGVGSYTYYDSTGFDPFTYDWAQNFHYDENAYACALMATNGSRNTYAGGASCPGHP